MILFVLTNIIKGLSSKEGKIRKVFYLYQIKCLLQHKLLIILVIYRFSHKNNHVYTYHCTLKISNFKNLNWKS